VPVDIFATIHAFKTSMRPLRPALSMPPRLWRVVASFAAGLVMVLTLSSVSPELHAWLHKPGQDKSTTHSCPHHGADSTSHAPGSNEVEDHDCAVTMFSHGVVHHAVALLTQPCEGILRAVNYRAFERLALAQPRYLHLPPQAPPVV